MASLSAPLPRNGGFRPLSSRRYLPPSTQETPETRFWRKFRNPASEQHGDPVTSVHCCTAAPFDYAVSAGTKVVIYSGRTGKVRRTVSRFKGAAFSGNLRSDGKLLVAGCANSHVQIFDVGSRSMLRVFKKHKGAVRVTKWSPDQVHILSASDDKTARWWDLATESELVVLSGHRDYVRCAAVSPASRELWATGSYDHTVKLWDMRTAGSGGGATLSVSHGAPVESVLLLPGGSLMISAGGNTLKVWDVLSGGRLVQEFSSHQKSITDLCLDGTQTRLLSSSLDANVKVYDLSTYEVTFALKYGAPVLALGVSANNRRLVAGLSTGELCVRTRATAAEAAAAREGSAQTSLTSEASTTRRGGVPLIGGTHRYFMRGRNVGPEDDDFRLAPRRNTRLKPYDALLRKRVPGDDAPLDRTRPLTLLRRRGLCRFQYQAALDAVLTTKAPPLVASMLEELVQRGALDVALSGRDEVTLEPLLSFLVKFVTVPRYAGLLLDVCSSLLTMYAGVLGHSIVVDELFVKLRKKLSDELGVQKDLMKLSGTLELLLNNALGGEQEDAGELR